jgi:enoyl-CoA hydratase/carnithine racemase
MYDDLHDLCEELDRDPDVRVVVLRGAGDKFFAAGTDIRQFLMFETREDALGYEARIGRVLRRLAAVTKPTIAMVQGDAAGEGSSSRSHAICDSRRSTRASSRPSRARSAIARRRSASRSSRAR